MVICRREYVERLYGVVILDGNAEPVKRFNFVFRQRLDEPVRETERVSRLVVRIPPKVREDRRNVREYASPVIPCHVVKARERYPGVPEVFDHAEIKPAKRRLPDAVKRFCLARDIGINGDQSQKPVLLLP